MSDMSGIPLAMQWEIKRLKVLQKETVTMTPNKTQDVKPGQTIIVDLPYNSKVDLSSFTWFYEGSTTHAGSTDINNTAIDGPAGYVRSRFFPRNSASVIQKFTVKINGGIKVDIPDYNFVYNMLHDYTQGGDALKRRQTGGENSDPSNKLYITDNDIVERRGYSIAPFDAANDSKFTDNMLARDKGKYCVRSWLSLFGGNASTQVVDTQMLGTVTVEIQLAPASILMTGTAQTAAGVAVGNATTGNTPSKNEVGRAPISAAIAQRGATLAAENPDYTLTNLEFRCVRYHMGPEFDMIENNVLGSGAKYKLWFPNYTVQSGRPVPSNNKATTERFSISTQSLDYVLGTFRLPGYDTIGQPLNTILSTQDSLEEGITRATAEEQVNAGLRRVYNQSRYFAHNGDSIVTTKWRIGNNSFEPQTIEEQYNSLLQHFNINQDTMSGIYPGINSIGAFREHSYASICSLNFAEKGPVYTISGLDTEQTPASIEWIVTSSTFTPAGGLAGTYAITNGNNCLPYLICAYNSHLEIGAGRIVNLIP
jgi:hypothetical protein